MVEHNCPNCMAVLKHEMFYCQFCGSPISRTRADLVYSIRLTWFMLILVSMVLPLLLSSKLDIFNLL